MTIRMTSYPLCAKPGCVKDAHGAWEAWPPRVLFDHEVATGHPIILCTDCGRALEAQYPGMFSRWIPFAEPVPVDGAVVYELHDRQEAGP